MCFDHSENKYEFYQITQLDSETLKIELISRTPWYQNFYCDYFSPLTKTIFGLGEFS